MKQKVLVLNQDYQALSVCSVERAFVLVFLQKAELVNYSSSRMLHTISTTFRMPTIIRLYNYIRLPYKRVALSRANVFRRDSNTCVYCNGRVHLTIDHVVPRSKGGIDSWENLVTACQRCNANKGDMTPDEAGMKMLRKPFRPSYIMYLRDFNGKIEDEWRPYLLMQ